MDPAISALDFVKAGAILADMVESFLAAGTTLTVNQVCDRYGVSMHVVYYWIERGHISAQQRKPGCATQSQSPTKQTVLCANGLPLRLVYTIVP
jgi:Helix-turn-helix domain